MSFPALLGAAFIEGKRSIVVAGTHGKTTTSAITSWLLEAAGKEPGFLVGGKMANFTRTARAGKGDFFAIEGDEYDTAYFDKGPKFLHYRPSTVTDQCRMITRYLSRLGSLQGIFQKTLGCSTRKRNNRSKVGS